ncbi:MAG: hypothetical protein ACE5MG_01675 [Candidatus Methylomirabilales bacterium]
MRRSRSPLLILLAVVVGGCVPSAPPEYVSLRPAPSRVPTYTVSGQTIIATPGPVSVAVQPLVPEEVEGYFRTRSTRVNPFQQIEDAITPFFIRIENRSKHQVGFDPVAAVLKDNEDDTAGAWGAADLYETFGDKPQHLQAALKGVITSYLVIPANKSREGLLIFPVYSKEAKALFLQLTSLYAGPTPFPLIFEFTVVPEESQSKK